MSEEEPIAEDNVVVDAPSGEEQVDKTPDYFDLEQDKLVDMLTSKDEEIAKSKKSYDELRSMNDKRFNESSERMAKLEGMLEVTRSQAEKVPEANQDDILKEMEDAIEEDPKNAAKYLMQAVSEMREVMAETNQSMSKTVEERLSKQNPVYKANKEFVDKAVNNGMSFKDALEFASEYRSNEVSQPGTPKAPGVVEASRSTSASRPVSAHQFSTDEIKMMKSTGLDDKDIKEIARDIARDMAKVGA